MNLLWIALGVFAFMVACLVLTDDDRYDPSKAHDTENDAGHEKGDR